MCDCKQDVYGLKYAQLPVYQRISTTDHLLAPGTCRCRCSSFCFRSRPTSCLYTGHILIGSGCFGPAVDGALAERRHHAHAVDILALEASPATGVVAHADSQAAGFGRQIKTGPPPPPYSLVATAPYSSAYCCWSHNGVLRGRGATGGTGKGNFRVRTFVRSGQFTRLTNKVISMLWVAGADGLVMNAGLHCHSLFACERTC